MPHMLGVFLFAGLDRILATRTLGEAAAGVYIGAAALAASVALLTTALNRALVPRIYDTIKRDHGEATRFLRRTSVLILTGGLLASSAAWFLSGMVEVYLGEGFEGAGRVFAVLVACQFMFMSYTSASNVLLYFERNAVLSIATISTGVLVAVLSYALAPDMGVMGIATALAVAWIIRWSLTYLFAELQLHKPAPAAPGEST
jgi:O-antigen/teichoic acid export membrane protein